MVKSLLVVIAMVIVCCPHATNAQVIPAALAGVTVDVALNKVADRVDSSAEKAASDADGVIIRGASDVNAEINNFREAYKDMLQKTVSSLDSEATMQLSQIFSDADALENKTAADATRILQLAQQVANVLPFAKDRPQVRSVEPAYAVFSATRKDDISLTVEGNFVYVADKDCLPYIEIGSKHLGPVHAETDHMLFLIPRSLLVPTGTITSLVKLPLVIPYKEGTIFKKRKESTFPLLLIGLPESPGKITVQIKTPDAVQWVRVDHVKTPQDNMQSDRDDHTDTRCGPNESDTIEANSAHVVFDHTEGSTWTYHPVRLNNPSVCFWFRTEHHGIGTSDKIWWHFEYNVDHVLPRGFSESNQVLQLNWGSSQVFSATAGTFKIIFDGFDGSHQEFLAQDHGNRFIDISTDGGGLKIAARPFEGILPINYH